MLPLGSLYFVSRVVPGTIVILYVMDVIDIVYPYYKNYILFFMHSIHYAKRLEKLALRFEFYLFKKSRGRKWLLPFPEQLNSFHIGNIFESRFY